MIAPSLIQEINTNRLPVRSGVQTLRIVSKRKPAFAGIDPYTTYIDRNSDDNIVPVTG